MQPCQRQTRLPPAMLSLSQSRKCSPWLPVIMMSRAPLRLRSQLVTASQRLRRQQAVQCRCLQRSPVPAQQPMLQLPVVWPSCAAAARSWPLTRRCRRQQWMLTPMARLVLAALLRARPHLTGQTSQLLLPSLRGRTHCLVSKRWIPRGEPVSRSMGYFCGIMQARCCFYASR